MNGQSTCYLIHFARSIGDPTNPRGQAHHYLSHAEDLEARLDAHEKSNGAQLHCAPRVSRSRRGAMSDFSLPWRSRFAGYTGHLVFQVAFRPLRVRVRRVWARRHPPAPSAPAQAVRALTEVGR